VSRVTKMTIHRAGPVLIDTKMTIHRAGPVYSLVHSIITTQTTDTIVMKFLRKQIPKLSAWM